MGAVPSGGATGRMKKRGVRRSCRHGLRGVQTWLADGWPLARQSPRQQRAARLTLPAVPPAARRAGAAPGAAAAARCAAAAASPSAAGGALLQPPRPWACSSSSGRSRGQADAGRNPPASKLYMPLPAARPAASGAPCLPAGCRPAPLRGVVAPAALHEVAQRGRAALGRLRPVLVLRDLQDDLHGCQAGVQLLPTCHQLPHCRGAKGQRWGGSERRGGRASGALVCVGLRGSPHCRWWNPASC